MQDFIFFNLFDATGPFLYPRKLQKKQSFPFYGRIERDQWYEMGKLIDIILRKILFCIYAV